MCSSPLPVPERRCRRKATELLVGMCIILRGSSTAAAEGGRRKGDTVGEGAGIGRKGNLNGMQIKATEHVVSELWLGS